MSEVTQMKTSELLDVVELGQENENYAAAVVELRFRLEDENDQQVVEQLRGGIRPTHGPTH